MNQSPPPQCDLGEAFAIRLKDHYRDRPLRWHMLSWLLVGIVLGLLLAPGFQASALAGFVFAGVLCCAALGILTYPVSDHFLWTVLGSGIGLFVAWLTSGWVVAGPWPSIMREMGLISGALLGGTSLIWLSPLRLAWRTFAGKRISRS